MLISQVIDMPFMGDKKRVTSISKGQLEYEYKGKRVEGKNICPLSFVKGKRLFRKTLANHVKPEYWTLINMDGFFFCPTKDCPIVYFQNDQRYYFGLGDVSTVVMHKMEIKSENRPVCYCKNVLEKTILDELLIKNCCDSLIDIQKFTEANTGKDCTITNPTGRCCGVQIKEILEWATNQRLDIEAPLMEEAMSCCSIIVETTQIDD